MIVARRFMTWFSTICETRAPSGRPIERLTDYQLSEVEEWTGARIFHLAQSDYKVWLERFAEGYEVQDQRPHTTGPVRFASFEEANALVAHLLQTRWEEEAHSYRRRENLPFPDQH